MRLIGTHDSPVNSIHITGDGRFAFVASSAGGLVRWTLADGLATTLVDDCVDPVFALSPTGEWLAVHLGDCIATGARTRLTDLPEDLLDDVTGLAVSPDARHIAIVGGDEHVEVRTIAGERVWAAKTDKWPYAVDFTPDGRVVVASWGGVVHVGELSSFDGDAWNTTWALEAHLPFGPAFDVAAIDDAHFIVAGVDASRANGGVLAVWNIADDACVARVDTDHGMHAVSLGAGGTHAIAGGNDQSLGLWSLPSLDDAGSFSLGIVGLGSTEGSDFPYPPFYTTSGPASVRCVAVNPTSHSVLCGLEDGMIVEVTLAELADRQGVVDLLALRKWLDENQVRIDRLVALREASERTSDPIAALEQLIEDQPELGLEVLRELERQAQQPDSNA
jgi:WD40 repeat protein